MVTEAELENMDFDEVLNEYMYQNKFHHFEGSTGVKRLQKLVTNMNPDYSGRFSGNSIIDFLEDNPGAIEAITNWIAEQNVDEWKDNLISELNIENDDSDEDEDNEE